MAETVSALLSRLSLTQYAETFAEEEINDVSLLTSMGADMLRENLEELGLDAPAIDALASALFPDDDGDEVVMLEENEGDGGGGADCERPGIYLSDGT